MTIRRTKTKLIPSQVADSIERLLAVARARQAVILEDSSQAIREDEYYQIGKQAAVVDGFLSGEWDNKELPK